jgi:hypothetical protein
MKNQFITVVLTGAVGLGISSARDSHVHLPVQTQQSIASFSASNNNNTTASWSGPALQTIQDANAHNARFLQPPYAGGNNFAIFAEKF